MIIWYRNSFLASLVSIFGCGAVILAFAAFRDGETVAGIISLLVGGGLVYLGSVISDRKKKKKAAEEQAAANNAFSASASSAQPAVRSVPAAPASAPAAPASSAASAGSGSASLAEIRRTADSFAAAGNHRQALTTLLPALADHPNDVNLLNDIGMAYRTLGEYDTALDYYRRASNFSQNDPVLNNNIAGIYLRKKQYELAKPYYETAMRLVESSHDDALPENLSYIYSNYALCIGRMGDLSGARQYLQVAEKLGYKNCDAVWQMLQKAD